MSVPVRVLQVLSGLGMGGAETWLMALLRRWAEDGQVQTDFLLMGGERDIFDNEAESLGANLYYHLFSRSQVRSFVVAFRQLLSEGAYDAIHCHGDYFSGWLFASGLGHLPRVRVAHVHNPWLHIESNYAISTSRKIITKIGKALTTKLATHVLGTSSEILCQYGFREAGTKSPKVATLHCGIDLDRFSLPVQGDREALREELGWSCSTKVVLIAGRLDRALEFYHPQNHKNTWLALNILREATLRNQNLRVIIAGDGPSRLALTQAVSGWGLSGKFRFLGIRDDMPRLMRASDVLLFPSAQEGLGMVAVEAQAVGLPVLASDAVPRDAIVIPEIYSAIPAGARIECWIDQLFAIIDRPRLDSEVCRSAFENSDFSIKNSAKKLEAVYRSAA